MIEAEKLTPAADVARCACCFLRQHSTDMASGRMPVQTQTLLIKTASLYDLHKYLQHTTVTVSSIQKLNLKLDYYYH